MRPLRPSLVAAVAAVVVLATSCGTDEPASREVAAPEPTVVATTAVLADVAGNALGDQADVEVLIPNGADPHAFAPTTAQVASLRDADLVLANGVGLEAGLDDALAAVEQDGVEVLRVGDRLAPIPLGEGSAALDPHVWMDVDRMARAATLIAEAAKTLPGVDAAAVDTSLARYHDDLAAADEHVQATLAAVPEEHRLLVADHAMLGYFAERYGFETADAARLDGATTVVRAVFVDTTASDASRAALVAAVGGDVPVVELDVDALGPPGSGAESYTGMLRTDAQRIVDALTD